MGSDEFLIFNSHSMLVFFTLLISLIFFTLSALHFYWIGGGRWGLDSAIPVDKTGGKVFEPSLFATAVVALGLMFFGLFSLTYAGVIPINLPMWFRETVISIQAGVFLLRAVGDFHYVGFFKKINGTQFAINDRKYFTPLCLAIFVLSVGMMISGELI